MKIKQCLNCGGNFTQPGKTCSRKCDGDLAEKYLAAAALDFFEARVVGPGGLDSDEGKKVLHDIVDQAYDQAVTELRKSFKIVE